MTRIQKILLPFALLLGACDPADTEVSEAELAAADEAADQSPDTRGKRGGKLARLDTDKDGVISLAEAKGTRLADTFGKLDRDADGKLTRDELHAMKGMRGDRGRGGHGGKMKDPAVRAAKLLERFDTDKNGSLSVAELQGSRLADKLAVIDTNKDGTLAKDELLAMKGRGHGPRGEHRDPAERAARMLEKRDANKDGSLSAAELQGSRMADKFAAIDANKDGSLAKDELMAMKGRGHGPRGEHRDPDERAAKMFERRDADKNGSLSAAEVAGSRMADKFAAIDADRNGAVTRDELVAFKTAHGRDAK